MKKMFAVLVLLSALAVLARTAHAQSADSSGQELGGSPSFSNRHTTSTVNRDVQIARPDLWADIRQFGAYETYSNTTATTTSGRPTLTLASAQSFKNGEYVTVYNAGPKDCTSGVGTVRLTPSLNAGGFNTVAARTGSSSFNYKVIAAGKFGCYTAASAAATTSGGNALGKQSVVVKSFSRSGQAVTVTTSSAHPFVVGSQVYVAYWGGNTDNTFWGFFIVLAVPDNHHFTYKQNLDSAAGATTSDTGGTAVAILCNHLTWTPVTGAWKYYVYGRTGNTYNLLGVTMEPYFDDYGSPMNDNRTFPDFIPTTAPSSGANDHLTAQINHGGGTTTLTLSANAGANVSGVSVVSDGGPALVAACAAFGAPCYVPRAGVTVNSYTSIPGNSKMIMAGSITTNDTLQFPGGAVVEGWVGDSSVAFAWEGNAGGIVGAKAYPQAVINNGGNVFSRVSFNCTASNGCLNIYEPANSGATNASFDYATFGTGNGNTTDYLGQHAIFGSGAFSYRWDKCLFITGSPGANTGASIGNSPIPTVIFKMASGNGANAPSGNWAISRSWFVGRASFEYDLPSGAGGGNYTLMKDIQTQNSFLPILLYTGSSNNTFVVWDLQDITPADFPTAIVANLSSIGAPLSGIFLVNATAPNQGGLFTTGAPLTGTFIHNVARSGLNRDYADPANGAFPNLPVTSNNNGSVGFLLQKPAAPTVTLGSHGSCSSNCVAPGTYYYAFAAADILGHYSETSPASNFVSPDGTQSVTVSWTLVPGQVLGYAARGVSRKNILFRGDSGGVGYAGAGYDDLGGTNYSCSTPCASGALPNGLSSGANGSGLTTQQLTLTGGGFSNKETGTFTANRARTVQDASGTESLTIASGTARLGTSSISAKSCASAITVTAKGVLTTDTLIVTPNAAPASHYASLTLSNSYSIPGSVNILVCNPTSEPLTPGAATVNWRVVR
jgi:hypothetical protein